MAYALRSKEVARSTADAPSVRCDTEEALGLPDLTAWFTNTKDDVLPSTIRQSRRGPNALLSACLLAAGVLLLLDATQLGAGADTTGVAVFGVLFVAVAVLRWFVAPRRLARRQLSSPEFLAHFLGTTGVRITDAGVSWADPISNSSITWAGVSRIEQERDGVVIHIGLYGGVRVPSRAFASMDEMLAFFNLAQSLQQSRVQSIAHG
jgi:hypothetical protein